MNPNVAVLVLPLALYMAAINPPLVIADALAHIVPLLLSVDALHVTTGALENAA